MSKKFKKIICIMLCLVVTLAAAPQALAATIPNIHIEENKFIHIPEIFETVSEREISRFDKYVNFDNDMFIITPEGHGNLSTRELFRLQSILNETNAFINDIMHFTESCQNSFYYVDGDAIVLVEMYMNNMNIASSVGGVNRIETLWWGLRIFISAHTIRTMGAGVAIGGVWVPHVLVSRALATLGIVATQATRGIIIEVYYIGIVIPKLVPIRSVRFQ